MQKSVFFSASKSFDAFPSPNGRIILPAVRLADSPSLDTAMDLELRDIAALEDLPSEDVSDTSRDKAARKLYADIFYTRLLAPLLNLYPKDIEIYILSSDGIYLSSLENLSAVANDTLKILGLFITGETGFCKRRYVFGDLVRIIRRLTAKDGCPWDKVQTHDSILPNLIEETYEAAAAVIAKSTEDMCEEFGDCLLQTVLNCDIAERAEEFSLADCIDTLCKKLYSRHTHIFGGDKADNEKDALDAWEKAKQKEKSYSGAKARLDKLPKNLPSLMLAQKSLKAILKEIPTGADDLICELKKRIDGLLPQANNKKTLSSTAQMNIQIQNTRILLLCSALYALCGGDAETDLLRDVELISKKIEAGISYDSLSELINY